MTRLPSDQRHRRARAFVVSSTLLAIGSASLFGPVGVSQAQPKGAVGAGSASASAAKQVTEANRKEAAERFKRGVQLQNDGSYDAAVIEFERAYELAPAYQVLYNIAVAYRDKGDKASALRAYERYLVEGGAGVDAKRRRDVETEISKLRDVVASVTIKSSVDGADVTLDGVPLGKTPFAQPQLVNVGRHTIEATKEGYRSDSQFVTLAGRDNRTIELNLREIRVEPPPATTTPPPATTLAPTSTPPPTASTTYVPPRATSDGSGARTLGYVLAIGGVVGVGIGSYLGIRAKTDWDDAKKAGCGGGFCPDSTAQDKAESARSSATFSTLSFGLGGAALVGGLVLILISPSSTDEKTSTGSSKMRFAPTVGQRAGGLQFEGKF